MPLTADFGTNVSLTQWKHPASRSMTSEHWSVDWGGGIRMAFDASTVNVKLHDFASPIAEVEGGPPGLSCTFGELEKMDMPPRVEVITGLARGENGLMNAPTNVGKSTLLRNILVSKACGRAYEPFMQSGDPARVVLFDSEDTLTFLRADISRMIHDFTISERQLVRDNLRIFCEAYYENELVQFSKAEHFMMISEEISTFEPDLIGIDTISRSFVITDENNNTEVKEKVMKPLKHLAIITNAAVLAVHHIGKAKAEEGSSREPAHRGRGASTFADLSRAIYNLESDTVNDRVILTCAKVKGLRFDTRVLKLDTEKRWFTVEQSTKLVTSYDALMEIFSDKCEHTTASVIDAMQGRVGRRAALQLLSEGVERGDLYKPRHGSYAATPEMLSQRESAESA